MDLYVKNKSFQTVAIVDVFESLIWTDRYYEPGDFELYTEVTPYLLSLFQEDFYLQIKGSDRTMIVESIQIKTNVETGNKLLIKGRSLESILDRRVIWEQTLIDNAIQAAIWTLIINAFIEPIGSTWDPYRKVLNMGLEYNADPLVNTIIIKAQYFLEYVSDVVTALCKQTGVGFKFTLNSDNVFVGKVYAGADRSYNQTTNPYVVFSPNFDNLLSSDFIITKRFFKSLAVILAQVDTEIGSFLRVTRGITNPDWQTLSGIDHRELFVDAQHIPDIFFETGVPIEQDTYLEQVRQYGSEQLEKNAIRSFFDGQIDPGNNYKYLTDYFMGDIVQIENEYGMKSRSRITEVTISENTSGIHVYPTFEPI